MKIASVREFVWGNWQRESDTQAFCAKSKLSIKRDREEQKRREPERLESDGWEKRRRGEKPRDKVTSKREDNEYFIIGKC